MALSDCLHCWDTPCSCGWEYRRWAIEDLKERMKLLKHVIKFKEENLTTVFSSSGDETEDDKKFLLHMQPLLEAQNEVYNKRRDAEAFQWVEL